jgi:hypothetical protein
VVQKELTQGDYITIAMDYLNFNREERIYWAETASHNSIAFFTHLGRNVHNGHVFKEDWTCVMDLTALLFQNAKGFCPNVNLASAIGRWIVATAFAVHVADAGFKQVLEEGDTMSL